VEASEEGILIIWMVVREGCMAVVGVEIIMAVTQEETVDSAVAAAVVEMEETVDSAVVAVAVVLEDLEDLAVVAVPRC
jgi:hypothetical protein